MKKLLPFFVVLAIFSTSCEKILGPKKKIALNTSELNCTVDCAPGSKYLQPSSEQSLYDDFEGRLRDKLDNGHWEVVGLNDNPDFILELTGMKFRETITYEYGCHETYDLSNLHLSATMQLLNAKTDLYSTPIYEEITICESLSEDDCTCSVCSVTTNQLLRKSARKFKKEVRDRAGN